MIKWNKLITFILIIFVTFGTIAWTMDDVLDNVTLGLDLRGGFEILYEVSPLNDGQELTQQTLKDTVAALLKRVDIIGVSEPEINTEGENRIRVRLAGITNLEEAREIIGKPATLTFRNEAGEILMTGSDLKENGASAVLGDYNQPIVQLKLKDADKFYQITKEYVDQRIAIYLDEEMLTNPVVRQPIAGGEAIIEGQRSLEEAKELADLLNAGALPVKMQEISALTVGAKLGQLALQYGVKAGIIGIVLVFLYMIVFYRVPGVIAGITLVAYMYLVLLFLTWMGATLTLPGIAAYILGVGMAVDANIITYERIKEELRVGKSLLSAVRAGSRHSLGTILDANLTTVIAGIVLFYFGTSSIQGFAVTLILGIALSMVTAVFGARWLLDLVVKSNLVTKPWYYGVKESEISEL